jgi:peptidoglycan hydrolase CwlO-like protein
MIRSLLPALLLIGCDPSALSDTPSAFEMPPPAPGAGTMTLVGPGVVVSGETATFEVTAPGLQPGDRVELGSGTLAGPGICPHRAQTGGSPCLDVTGRMQKLGVADAADHGGLVSAVFDITLTRIDPFVHVQAFFLNGGSSATSNVVPVEVAQPWPELDPRVEALEDQVAALQAVVDAQADTITALTSDLTLAQGDLADVNTELASNTNWLNTFNTEMTSLDIRLSSVQSDVAPLLTLPGDLSTAQMAITQLQSDVSFLSGVPGDLSGALVSIGALQTDVMGLQTASSLLQSDVGMLSSEVDMVQSDLGTAQMDIDTLELELDGLSDLPMRVAGAELDIDGLQLDLMDARSDLTLLQGDLSSTQTALGSAMMDITNLSSSLSSVVLDLSDLTTDMGDAQADITALQADLAAMGDELTVTGPLRVGSTIYNAWSSLVPMSGSYSSNPLHLKTGWGCTSGVMWNVQFVGYNFLAERTIHTSSVGYAYASAGGIVYNQDRDFVDGTTVATTYCSSDGKVSFKLTSNAVGANKWHASNVVLNLVGGPSSYAAAAANSFEILASEMRAGNF